MRRRDRIKCILILTMAAVLVAGMLVSKGLGGRARKPHYEAMTDAARTMERCMEALKAERLRRGLPLDEEDRLGLGLMGADYTAITTTLGSPEAKRTSCQPDMAALVYDLLVRAGVRPGDRVGLCCSGSFPALNLAAVCAAEAMGAEPVAIVSIGASTHGANLPEFTAPEMLYFLYEQGFVKTSPAGVTLGGDGDLAKNMGFTFFPEETAAFEAMLSRLAAAGISVTRWESRAEDLAWRESVYGDIDCFISVGGHTMAMGEHGEGYALGQGLITQQVSDGEGYLLGHYLSRGVPCLSLLNVKQLCLENGLPFDPPALEKIGESDLYYEKAYPKWPLVLALALACGLLVACKRVSRQGPGERTDPSQDPHKAEDAAADQPYTRRCTMQQNLKQKFLNRYETAESRRTRAMAVYNAVKVAVPPEEIPAFLGEEGEAFLSFIRTLQNEDMDIGTSIAREEDAPSEAYLAALAEKLRARS